MTVTNKKAETTVWALGWLQGRMQLLTGALRPFRLTLKIHKVE